MDEKYINNAKKKIAIITLNGYFNYGNRLQNYALQEALKKYGYEVDTLINPHRNPNKSITQKIMEYLRRSPYKNFYYLKDKLETRYKYRNLKELIKERKECFIKFTSNFINERKIKSVNELQTLNSEYDYFVTGSDQVWNPNYTTNIGYYLLDFSFDKKRIAYAPSFGIDRLPKQYYEKYRTELRKFINLSVRESKGADIIKNLINKDVPVLIDPTMLLSQDEWNQVARQSHIKYEKKYILTYFLGDIPRNAKKIVNEIKKQYGYELIRIADRNDLEHYNNGPSEFVDYIKNCEIFLTDSFHGAVFSIIYNRPFVAFKRKGPLNMFSRIETLLDKFELSSRSYKKIRSVKDLLEIDYANTNIILDKERELAKSYLVKSLGVKMSEASDGDTYAK